ncbi:MAG: hypothetical protein U1E15_00310 [Hyphomicrobiales bacterium]
MTSISCGWSSFIPGRTRCWPGELARFKKAEFIWCQEEPQNMGGTGHFVQRHRARAGFHQGQEHQARCVGRPASASTATGLMSRHLKELKMFLDEALA